MTLRSRLAIAARYLRVPLSSPSLLELAGCEKTTLYIDCQTCAQELLETIRNTYPKEDPTTITEITLLTFEAVMKRCVTWARDTAAYREGLFCDAPSATETREAS